MPLVLVIEDEQPIRTNLVKIFKFNGFEAIGAEDGEKGIEMAKQYSPDLIVCDIMMPGISGYKVLETLAQDLETATIPFIFLSAKSDRSDIRQGMELGADDYLTKPFSDTELIRAVQSRLKKQATIRQPVLNSIKQAVGKLNELAYYDPLTELPNRILLHQKLEEVLAQAQNQRRLLAVLCLQMHRYKEISAIFGDSNTDLLLQAIAQRLTQWIQTSDLAARLNESEFCVVLVRNEQQNITHLVQELLNILSSSYLIEGQEICVSFNIGVALYSPEYSRPDEILNHARLATRWQAKSTNSYQFYSVEMMTRSTEKRQLEASLHQALKCSEFELYYQPQVNLITGRIIGAEALLRWRHPEKGLISPDVFIPLAEEMGLIVPIGEWVLQTACAEAQLWKTLAQPPIRIAVNLSSQQVKQATFREGIISVLHKTEILPESLELEITETEMMNEIETMAESLHQLKALGIQIVIDDFGTGYSSLAYLKNFPVDTLKIDRLFISDMMTNQGSASIVIAIMAMAHSLKLRVVAEGVETQEQLNFLRQHGCHSLQGFLFNHPLPAHQFRELLTTNPRLKRTAHL